MLLLLKNRGQLQSIASCVIQLPVETEPSLKKTKKNKRSRMKSLKSQMSEETWEMQDLN